MLSAGAGFVGMTVATMANARTAEAAKEGPGKALPIAFRGGAVMGFTVAGLALLGAAFDELIECDAEEAASALACNAAVVPGTAVIDRRAERTIAALSPMTRSPS